MEDRFKFRAWDGKVMHSVDTIEFPQGGIRWYGHGAGSGIAYANPEYDWKKDSVLMQCTGLKDKNGQLIYEGDVLAFTSELVKFGTGERTGRFCTKHRPVVWVSDGRWGTSDNLVDSLRQEHLTEYAVIAGNIHENPELLNTGEV